MIEPEEGETKYETLERENGKLGETLEEVYKENRTLICDKKTFEKELTCIKIDCANLSKQKDSIYRECQNNKQMDKKMYVEKCDMVEIQT